MEVDQERTSVKQDNDVPQGRPLSENQSMNNAGGYGWKIDDMTRLRRFLCLGAEGGTYYVSEKELGMENAKCIARMIEDGKGKTVVSEIVTFSVEGRAAKQNPIIFALAMCARQEKDAELKNAAYKVLSEVCRIPTHLFAFVDYCEKLSRGTGWGRAHRKAVSSWYNKHKDDPLTLAMHVTKYQNRNGWCHRDLFRLSHLKPDSDGVALVAKYIIKGLEVAKSEYQDHDLAENVLKALAFLSAVEEAKSAENDNTLIRLVTDFHLVREHIPTKFLNSLPVWHSLLQKMPMTAMMRNLGKMTSINMLEKDSQDAQLVIDKLSDENALRRAKIHPFNVLVALVTYKKGSGVKGSLKWSPNPDIVSALDRTFYKTFKFVEPTNQRYCLAVDVSGSMDFYQVNGSPVTPREAAAAMAMLAARTENNVEMVGFSTNLVNLPITADMPLDKVISRMSEVPMGGTDCAQPMVWAKQKKKQFDVFIVYTDCETWAGEVHPAEALRQYRQSSGIWNAKLIVVAMTSNGFTIADPEDPGMLDIAGFDSAAPEVMRQFVLGMI